MQPEALKDIDVVERLVGERLPWLSTPDLVRASEVILERMEKFDVFNSPEYTPQLREAAQATGRELASMLPRRVPIWPSATLVSSYREFLLRVRSGVEGGFGRAIGR